MEKVERPETGLKAGVITRGYPLAVLVAIGVSTLLMLPVLLQVFPNGDDFAQHYWWASEFYNALREGVLYPRWLGGAYYGRGSPVMLYYPPLPFFVTSLFQALGAQPLTALALDCWVALAASGLAMYWFSRLLLSPYAGLIAAAIYMALHYHLFDLYQRAALNEFWAFVWIPLVLGWTHRAITQPGWRAVPPLALSYAALLMTHLPSSYVTTLVLPIYAVFQTRDWRGLARGAAGGALGGGVAAVYMTSVLFETDYLREIRSVSRAGYDAGFLFEDIVRSFKSVPFPSNGNFELFVLASNWIAVGMVLLVGASAVMIWTQRRSSERPLWQNGLLRAVLVVAAISILMTTRLSLPVWQVIPRLRVIQFPVRWYVLATAGASVLAALALSVLSRRSRWVVVQAVTLFVVVAINLAISGVVVARAPFEPEALQARLEHYTDVMEYHPKWWDEQRHEEVDKAPVVVEKGKAAIEPVDEYGISQAYRVSAETESTLKLRTLYFPGWVAHVDGQPVDLGPNREGHIRLTVGPGDHLLSLEMRDTSPRTAGKLISAASLLATLVLFIAARRKAKAIAPEPVVAGVTSQVREERTERTQASRSKKQRSKASR